MKITYGVNVNGFIMQSKYAFHTFEIAVGASAVTPVKKFILLDVDEPLFI